MLNCPSCYVLLTDKLNSTLRHKVCGNTMCFDCWMELSENLSKCTRCNFGILIEDMVPHNYDIHPLGDKKIIYTYMELGIVWQMLLDYRIKKTTTIFIMCKKHAKPTHDFDMIKNLFYCHDCKIETPKEYIYPILSFYKLLASDLEARINFCQKYYERLNRYFKDKIYEINDLIISKSREYVYNDIIEYLRSKVGIYRLRDFRFDVERLFEYLYKYNQQLYTELKATKEYVAERFEAYEADKNKLEKIWYNEAESEKYIECQHILRLESNSDSYIKEKIEEIYKKHPNMYLMGRNLSFHIKESIYMILCRHINDKEISLTAIQFFKLSAPVSHLHYNWLGICFNPYIY